MRGLTGIFHLRRCCYHLTSTAKVIGCTNVASRSVAYYNFHKLNPHTLNCKPQFCPSLQHLSTSTQPRISWECSLYETISRKLEHALEEGYVDESWEAFKNFKSLHGFPRHQLVNKLIVILSYSSDRQWLREAYDLSLAIFDEKPNLLHHGSLTRLSLALARAQMSIPASTVLRVILEKFRLPSSEILDILFSHLVKSQIGSYLASEILIEICDYCSRYKFNGKSLKQVKPIQPSTIMFNIVLDSCLQFKSVLKAQQIVELMPQTGVVADANTIVTIAQLYEMIGQRDELKKLQAHIDAISSVILNRHYQQFYDSLMSLHFKFNDLAAAAELVLDLYRHKSSHQLPEGSFAIRNGLQGQCLFQIGSSNLRTGSTIAVDPSKLQKDLILHSRCDRGLVVFVDGKLVPSNKVLAKLINGYVKEAEVRKLSNLLIKMQKEVDLKEVSLCSDVMDACIQLGWLDTAHDILDDLELAAVPVGASTYASLLQAYSKANMSDEAKLILNQIRKAGHSQNLSDVNVNLCEDHGGRPLDKRSVSSKGQSRLVGLLDREIREEGLKSSMIYELNASVLFFCKAKMMDDALKTVKRMQERNIQPTVQTFSYLVNGYSSLRMYRQITILWGEIRSRLEDRILIADRDLFDSLLCNFLRGGYFERVMDIVNYMLRHNMFIDKWKYKREFLKLHKDLYRSLKVPDERTDAQSKRLDFVRSFRKWVGVD